MPLAQLIYRFFMLACQVRPLYCGTSTPIKNRIFFTSPAIFSHLYAYAKFSFRLHNYANVPLRYAHRARDSGSARLGQGSRSHDSCEIRNHHRRCQFMTSSYPRAGHTIKRYVSEHAEVWWCAVAYLEARVASQRHTLCILNAVDSTLCVCVSELQRLPWRLSCW